MSNASLPRKAPVPAPTPRHHKLERALVRAVAEFGAHKSDEFLIWITARRMGAEYGEVVEAVALIYDSKE
jgi:hypothetical protein